MPKLLNCAYSVYELIRSIVDFTIFIYIYFVYTVNIILCSVAAVDTLYTRTYTCGQKKLFGGVSLPLFFI